MSNILKESDVYKLEIADIKDTEGSFYQGYVLTNIKTGVKEVETFSLAEALSYIMQTEGLVQEFFNEREADLVLHS